MRKDKRDAEVLRIIFGESVGRFQYHWIGLRDGRYEMVAIQKPSTVIDPLLRSGWPLRENTLQVLEGLQEALPIFNVPINNIEAVKLFVEINGRCYNVFDKAEWE